VIDNVDGVNQQIGQIDRGAAGDAIRQRDRAAGAGGTFYPDDRRACGGSQHSFERSKFPGDPERGGRSRAVIKEFPTRNFHMYLEKIGMKMIGDAEQPGPMDTNQSTLE
jgi:hypothetical protein